MLKNTDVAIRLQYENCGRKLVKVSIKKEKPEEKTITVGIVFAPVFCLLLSAVPLAFAADKAPGDYEDEKTMSFVLKPETDRRNTISAGGIHTVAIKADGTVVATKCRFEEENYGIFYNKIMKRGTPEGVPLLA